MTVKSKNLTITVKSNKNKTDNPVYVRIGNKIKKIKNNSPILQNGSAGKRWKGKPIVTVII